LSEACQNNVPEPKKRGKAPKYGFARVIIISNQFFLLGRPNKEPVVLDGARPVLFGESFLANVFSAHRLR
jgi:hypothetical protein